MSNISTLIFEDSCAVWVKGIDEMKDLKDWMNKELIGFTNAGLPPAILENFNEWIKRMRDPEYNDLIVDENGVFLPRNFVRLIPVLRWPIVKREYEEINER